MQPPLDIPSRASGSHYQESPHLVGSPEMYHDQHYPSDTDSILGRSNPMISSQALSTSSPRRRLGSESQPTQTPLAHPRERFPEHQWSLFGQLMENEGFLPLSTQSTPHGIWRGSDVDYFAPGTSSASGLSASGLSASGLSSSGLSPRPASIGPPYTQASSRDVSQPRTHNVVNHPTTHEYDTDDYSSIASTYLPPTPVKRSWFSSLPFGQFSLSTVYRNILKCAIAYFIASLFTFSPFLSRIISDMNSSPSSSGHMVATVAVYFNPAKTVGAMLEADLFCLLGLLYAAIVCLVSMSMFWWLEVKPGWELTADVVALVWIGMSIGVMAWMKVWMENPSFNTACSMTAIIIFVVVIKEGGLSALIQVSVIVICGFVVSNLVCLVIWPQTAISNLQLSMTQTLESFSTILPMLTRSFILENDASSHILDMEKIQRAVENHQNSFTTLQKNLREAKSEWALTRATGEDSEEPGFVDGYSQLSGRRSYEDAVDSLNRLAQHLNGLRSGTRLQYELTKAGIKRKGKTVDSDETQGVEVLLRAAAAMFGDLVDELGPPLKALSSASTFTLNRLRDVCVESRKEKKLSEEMQPHEFSELVDEIEAALTRFESTSNHAVLRFYRRNDEVRSTASHDPLSHPIRDSDNENVFLVYFFIFTLQEFSKELIFLVDAIERIYCYEQRLLRRKAWWYRLAVWIRRALSTLNFSRKASPPGRKRTLNIRSSLAYMIPPHRKTHPAFPKIRPHAPDTVQTPARSQLTFVGKLNQTLWTIGKRLRERDTKFAIKVGMATVILALPAFVDSTRETFVEYWGDWALISFFIVMSPTIGATNYLSLQRFLGTLFGAAVAVGLYTLSPDDPVALSIFGFLFSIPCFYFAVAKPKYVSASRFVILTYNLTCLFCYNLRQKDVEVIDIGFLRAVAVTAGVLWAAFVSRFWWPSEARRELGNALSEFCLNIGWLYTRLVASNSFAPEYQRNEDTRGPSTHLFTSSRRLPPTRLSNSIHEFMAMELHLQIKLIELQSLLAQAQHEPRLKGPFPVALYRQILISLQTILDKLHSMRCVTTREEWWGVRQDFIVPVNKERREMVGNIILSFSTLAASFRLKAPLPPYLPPVEKSRLQLVDAIRKLDVVKNRDAKISRQLLFFAYALTMRGVTMELEFLGRTLQNAFGVIGQTAEEFEMLFLPLTESEGNIEHVA